jgi:hypothetical protein
MQRVLILAVALLVAAPAFRSVAFACGDKFLMVGRGARFNQVYAAVYPAAIILYARAGHGASTVFLDPRFQASLTRAGQQVQVVRDEEQLARALQAGRVDLVLAAVADMDVIKPTVEQSPSKPTVLPVMYKPTKEDVAIVKARYQSELKSSDRPARYLSQIDEEMKARMKQRGANAKGL